MTPHGPETTISFPGCLLHRFPAPSAAWGLSLLGTYTTRNTVISVKAADALTELEQPK